MKGQTRFQSTKSRFSTPVLTLLTSRAQKRRALGSRMHRSHQDSTYRHEVEEEFLRTGIPVGKIDRLRPLLEKSGYRHTSSTNLKQYIALIFKQEVARIKKESSVPGEVEMTRDVSVIFDRSTRQGEAIAVIVHLIHEGWNITLRLIRFNICSKSVISEG